MSSLLDLPYDIRHTIYSHLFPRSRHLYLQAIEVEDEDRPLYLVTADCSIPVAFFQTCRALHKEASEHIYNGYIFDVYGLKSDIVNHYQSIQTIVEKYARDEVHVRAFSNGRDSATGCISVAVGGGKLALVEGRGRGEPTIIDKLRKEGESDQGIPSCRRLARNRLGAARLRKRILWWAVGAIGAVVCVVVATVAATVRSWEKLESVQEVIPAPLANVRASAQPSNSLPASIEAGEASPSTTAARQQTRAVLHQSRQRIVLVLEL